MSNLLPLKASDSLPVPKIGKAAASFAGRGKHFRSSAFTYSSIVTLVASCHSRDKMLLRIILVAAAYAPVRPCILLSLSLLAFLSNFSALSHNTVKLGFHFSFLPPDGETDPNFELGWDVAS